MPRSYYPQRREYTPEADDMREREGANKKPAWQKWLKWIGIGVLILIALLFILSATGNLKGSSDTNNVNGTTVKQTKYEQITTYIITQQKQGMSKEEIVQRLQLAGFNQEDIETGYTLSDPVIQRILELEKQGQTRQQIVETLLNQGIAPEEIQARLNIIDETRSTGLGDTIKNNIIWILLGLVALYFIWKWMQSDDEKKLAPKVYTLDECEEYAREYLEKKGKTFNPSKQYRNRPDIRQYRFIYEEPLFPEFNDHRPTGHKVGKREYFLLAIGYDKEVIDYLETHDDNRINPFLYGAPKSFEQAGSKEYMDLRGRSEKPIDEIKQSRTGLDTGADIYNRPTYRSPSRYRPRRTTPYIRPGPVGYEEP